MDPAAIATLVTAAASGAAGEAGRRGWESLVGLFRRGRGDGQDVVQAELVDPGDEAAVRGLAERIAERAAADPEFHRALEDWARAHRPAPSVRNEISGNAQVSGHTFQAGGDITFNGPPPPVR
ncbi:hypothetical protein G5C51_37480 [Streptomyces sp. A7024]|uniref:Uncharacterized protein n=1 Tax=Streptomyces coryli TaxID=1128680 RepID=A0A6G4UD13_9ACTN|nr:hypothetical protein [Streptomyces coryli]NGN69566.1 hypothetical protein [Streptomyces coryli]